jgi:hypothetical protein
MFDIVHAVLPTKLLLGEFYYEYTGLWRHVLDVRYKNEGKLKTYLQLGAALATRKVSMKALQKGHEHGEGLQQTRDVPLRAPATGRAGRVVRFQLRERGA